MIFTNRCWEASPLLLAVMGSGEDGVPIFSTSQRKFFGS